jgi:hypothetical protein
LRGPRINNHCGRENWRYLNKYNGVNLYFYTFRHNTFFWLWNILKKRILPGNLYKVSERTQLSAIYSTGWFTLGRPRINIHCGRENWRFLNKYNGVNCYLFCIFCHNTLQCISFYMYLTAHYVLRAPPWRKYGVPRPTVPCHRKWRTFNCLRPVSPIFLCLYRSNYCQLKNVWFPCRTLYKFVPHRKHTPSP